jgi:hypothetical protein
MSDKYKHISEKAARKASDELSRIKTAQRTEARMKLQERARAAGDSSLVNSVTVPAMIDAADNQLAVVH